ncbi:hypothetical protein ED733_005812 [Metarhizium rileyi]|uniref:Uncharacterized protein n=1 Tax=Metarhizium rileyi (strain RCEF 4871) TaxID=1649241 RepID=A0A5C6GDD9_METRR|nr:hypothetical protein ED733_005812 [Metarhizium rileyi]
MAYKNVHRSHHDVSPQPPPLFGASPSSITERVLAEDATFSNVRLPLAQAENAASAERWLITCYRNFSPDAALQEGANVAATIFDGWNLRRRSAMTFST